MRIAILVSLAALLSACNQRLAAPADRYTLGARSNERLAYSTAARGDGGGAAVPRDATGRFVLQGRVAMLIREAHVSLTVDSVAAAMRSVNILARRYGGVVATSAVYTVSAGQSATLVIRVPSDRLDSAIAGLSAVGKVENARVTAQDVGEEFVDVGARLQNSRRLEQRLLDVLAHKTGRLKDVLEVEDALARVREAIERMEGRRRYLKTRSAISTLEVTVHLPAPSVGQRFAATFGGAVDQAWSNTVWLSSLVISSLGVVLPLAALAVPVWLVWRRRRREAVATRTA